MKPLKIDNLIKFLNSNERTSIQVFNELLECDLINEVDLGEPGFIAIKNLTDIENDLKSYGESKFTTTEEKLVRKSMLIIKSILEVNFESLTGYDVDKFIFEVKSHES